MVFYKQNRFKESSKREKGSIKKAELIKNVYNMGNIIPYTNKQK